MKEFIFPKHRICPDCDWKLNPSLKRDGKTVDELEQHADHLATHTPDGKAWTAAHLKIQAGKDLAKAKSKEA